MMSRKCEYFGERNPKIYYADGGIPITTLVVALRYAVSYNDLLDYFSKFGEVRKIIINIRPHHSFAHVIFYYGESAAKLIGKEFHTIGGFRLQVRMADYTHQEHPLDIPMDLSIVTGKRLMDLNDECLETIFSLKFISILDLCAVARTNHRFKNIANRIFSLSHQVCNIRSLVNRISDAKRVIVTFGYLISDLWIGEDCNYDSGKWWRQWANEDWISLMYLIIGCCNETLDTLQLDQCVIPKHLATRFKKLFINLQKLSLYDCMFQGSENLFADCGNLVELTVSGENSGDVAKGAQNMRFVMNHVFPKLERFHYDNGDSLDLAIFLSQHNNLKSLNISGCEDSFFLLPIIAHNCRQLEELKIDFTILSDRTDGTDKYEQVIESLQMIDHLRTLKINCVGENITELISKLDSLKSIEFLELWEVAADSEFTTALSQMKRLQVLRLMDCKGIFILNRLADLNQLTKLAIHSNDHIDLDIILLVKRLNSLKSVHIGVKTYALDEQMYLNLVSVVRDRPMRSQQSLEITCYTANDAVVDLQKVGNNRQIVKLRIEL